MRTQYYTLNGEQVTVNSVETEEDCQEFYHWAREEMYRGPLGFDSETTGLDIYSGDTLRLVQFGNHNTGWVIPIEPLPAPWAERIAYYRSTVIAVLMEAPILVCHNAAFDLSVADQHLGVRMDELWPKTRDTRILAHLIEPRSKEDGFITVKTPQRDGTVKEFVKAHPDGPFGHGLEDLLTKYIDPTASDEVKKLMAKLARQYKTVKAKIFKEIRLDDPEYNLYSGMDPVFNVRLFNALSPLVPDCSRHLIGYEHDLAAVCAQLGKQAFELDRPYTKALSARFKDEEREALWHLDTFFDLQTAGSPPQLVEAFQEEFGYHTEADCPTNHYHWALGQQKPECDQPHFTLTPKKAPSVNSDFLEAVAGPADVVPAVGSAAHLANAVIEAKRTRKWRTSWVDKFLAQADADGRVHANFNPLRARTARMSITGIPAQTLPSRDWIIRRCFRADQGHRIASVDYDAQELRVLAALAQDEAMMAAFREGKDLHQMTADAAGVKRKVGKMANFLKVYGGGRAKLALQAGIDEELAAHVLKSFSDTYPQVAEYSRYLQRLAEENGYIVTPLGRRLPVDEDRSYAALNYCLDPDTPILTADLRHVPASSIQVGDRLVGFDEYGGGKGYGHRKFRTAEVEAVSTVIKPSVRVWGSDGRSTVCSTDHKWLVRRPDKQPRFAWVAAEDLGPGDLLLSVGTWEHAQSWAGGYLAGLYDGEGCLQGRAGGKANTSLTFSQLPGLVMSQFCAAMDSLGLTYSYQARTPSSTSPTDSIQIGGVPRIMKTLGTLRPARFMPRVAEIYDGAAIVGGRQLDEVTVAGVEPVGDRVLTSIQTSTRTLIANGYLSHNCVQSTSRDITARGVLNLHKHGFTPYLRLVIHDEVLLSLPEEHAAEMTRVVAHLMGTEFRGVNISASGEVGGRSWGSLYACNKTRECGLPTHDDNTACEPSDWSVWKDDIDTYEMSTAA